MHLEQVQQFLGTSSEKSEITKRKRSPRYLQKMIKEKTSSRNELQQRTNGTYDYASSSVNPFPVAGSSFESMNIVSMKIV